MSKRRKIIGAKVRLLVSISNCAGITFEKGTIMEIWGSFRGYSLKDGEGRRITRVPPYEVEFLEAQSNEV